MINKKNSHRKVQIGFLFILTFFGTSICPAGDNLLTNGGFEDGTTSGWFTFGSCTLGVSGTSHTGSYSGLVTDRGETWHSAARSLIGLISDGQTCSISGWVMLQNSASATIKITIKQVDDSGEHYHPVNATTASDSGWVELFGFFTLDVTGTLSELTMYFEGPAAGVNYYIDDGSVEIVSGDGWEAEANNRIEQIRKGDFRITAVSAYAPNVPVEDVNVQIEQIKHHFAFGSEINHNVSDPNYALFFKNHFEWGVMGNESKWYSNEPTEDYVTYVAADEIYDFCAANDIKMRGHCIFWAAENMVQDWVKALSTAELQLAVEDRLYSAVNHFKDKFLHWDVNNEMCNNSYFADRLGYSIRPWMFQTAHSIDPNCLLFLNDYNVINGGYNLTTYKQMAYDLAAEGAPVGGLGVQCHMNTGFSPATVKARFDSVAEVNLPIWVTEFDVSQADENIRADELEDFYRVAFSHPAVEGILMWGFWEDSHWRENCHIVNSDWSLNAAGERYEQLMAEWTTKDSGITDANGSADFRGFYGTYTATLTPEGAGPTVTTIEVRPGGPNEFRVELEELGAPENCRQVHDFGYALPGDLDRDCRVDYSDLMVIIEQWLSSEPVANPPCYCPDIYYDEQVNLYDFAVLAFDWLRCNNPEDSECTANW